MSRKKKNQINPENVPNAEETDSSKLSSRDDSLTGVTSVISRAEELTEADEQREEEQTLDVEEVNKAAPTDNEYEKELRRFIIPKLRSASYRWHYRSEAIKAARVERGRYKCAQCGDATLKNGQFAVDHTEPVVPLDGWNGEDYNQYLRRLLCKTEGFQILCEPCHTLKTDMEVQLRKIRREAKKRLAK
jgi:hypothetical protein